MTLSAMLERESYSTLFFSVQTIFSYSWMCFIYLRGSWVCTRVCLVGVRWGCLLDWLFYCLHCGWVCRNYSLYFAGFYLGFLYRFILFRGGPLGCLEGFWRWPRVVVWGWSSPRRCWVRSRPCFPGRVSVLLLCSGWWCFSWGAAWSAAAVRL